MADLKISQLTALTSIDAVGADVLPVVDTSATTTKKISLADISEYVINDIIFPAGVSTLDDLSNVTVPSPSNGDLLAYNGAFWINSPPVGSYNPVEAAVFS